MISIPSHFKYSLNRKLPSDQLINELMSSAVSQFTKSDTNTEQHGKLIKDTEQQEWYKIQNFVYYWPSNWYDKNVPISHILDFAITGYSVNGISQSIKLNITNSEQIKLLFYQLQTRFRNTKIFFNKYIIKSLINKGYARFRNEHDILTEVDRLQCQFPGSDINIITSGVMADYINTYIPKLIPLHNVRISKDNTTIFKDATIIFSDAQLKTNYKLHADYTLERIPRHWRITMHTNIYLGVDVAHATQSLETTINTITKHSRFAVL